MTRLIDAKHITHVFHSANQKIKALDDVSIHLDDREILGIIGESGSGKSTLLRILSGILIPKQAEIQLFNQPLNPKDNTRFSRMQMIFQDARSSFDELYTIEESLNEVRQHLNPDAIENRFLLQEVGLDMTFAKKYPSQMSGGECQRAAIARLLACHPDILLCDEITSALDVITQKKICELLLHLCQQHHISTVFVSHDIALVSQLCSRIMIMQKGKVVEEGDTTSVLSNPQHAYTKELLQYI